MVNANNQTGGGIAVSDDGGFFDWNDGYITYEPLCCGQGLKVNSNLTITNGSLCLSNGCRNSWPGLSTRIVVAGPVCGCLVEAVASCNSDEIITGGGYRQTVWGGAWNSPDASYPRGNSWVILTPCNPGCFEVYAVCLKK